MAVMQKVIENGLVITPTTCTIKKGIFADLDGLKETYENLDRLMNELLMALSPQIAQLPAFMGKVKMIMIPSVGYFTVVSKLDPAF